MTMTRIQAGSLAVLALGAAVSAWFITGTETPAKAPTKADATTSAPARAVSQAPQPLAPTPVENSDLEQVRMEILATYGRHLSQPKTQIRMLEELMRYLAEIDPEHWQANMQALLQAWFPDQHAALLERLNALLAYQAFMEDQRYALRAMSPGERREFIWAKRQELFGDDAELIWQAELQNQALAQSLQSIDATSGTPIGKAAAYREAIKQTYGDQADRVLENRRQELTDRFLTLASVQASLHEQSPSDRYAALRSIRSELGMEEQALNRWSELDRTRDERWNKGDRYLAERAAILARYDEGPERQQALEQASVEVFGEEMAEVIRSEEAAGYFRFESERVYGQN